MQGKVLRDLLELMYDLELSDTDCLREVATLVERHTRAPTIAAAARDGEETTIPLQFGDRECLEATLEMTAILPPAVAAWAWSVPARYYDLFHMFEHTPHALEPLRQRGFGAAVGFWCPTGRGMGVNISSFFDRPQRGALHPGGALAPAAGHIAAAWRLRSALTGDPDLTPDAVLRTDGSIADLDSHAVNESARDVLRRAVRERERSNMSRRGDGEALWPELIAGRWTMVDRIESDGKRYVVAYRNGLEADALDGHLGELEEKILAGALEGRASKVIAMELGLSEATASRCISRTLRKLRVESLFEVMQLAPLSAHHHALGEPGRRVDVWVASLPAATLETMSQLTLAEMEVVRAIAAGHSQARVARQRGTSRQTVANQVASAFRKLGIGSRRELQRVLAAQSPAQ